MQIEWDEITKQNAFYGVLSFPKFERPDAVDQEAFWLTGRDQADDFIGRAGFKDTSHLEMVEIGCGLGRMTHRFAQRFRKVYAVDISPEMLNRARLHWTALSNVKFILGRGNDLPGISDASIDFVFSFQVLQHIIDPGVIKSYIRETARVLKSGALAMLQFRTSPSDFSFVTRFWSAAKHPRHIFRRIKKFFQPASSSLQDQFRIRYKSWRGCSLNVQDIELLSRSVGLKIEAATGIGTQYTYYSFRKV